ncbi:MAG: 3'-5' exonuclease [Burkholderiales bacterium]|nr:3'-5' exonuclease [Burkholderiales bacterium]
MSWLDRLKATVAGPATVDPSRWIMLDVETSGLDMQKDRLLAIAAIAMRVDWPTGSLSVDLSDSFEVVLRQDEVSNKDNILLHGIGAQSQRDGLDPRLALQAFADYVGSAPLLAFHAAFDQRMINRYARQHLGQPLPNVWVDVDHLCAVTYEKVRARALDDWMAHFGIHCAVRHQAAADTLAECELLQHIWPKVVAQCKSWADVQRLAAQHRWLPRAG